MREGQRFYPGWLIAALVFFPAWLLVQNTWLFVHSGSAPFVAARAVARAAVLLAGRHPATTLLAAIEAGLIIFLGVMAWRDARAGRARSAASMAGREERS